MSGLTTAQLPALGYAFLVVAVALAVWPLVHARVLALGAEEPRMVERFRRRSRPGGGLPGGRLPSSAPNAKEQA